ncbi:GalU regulator GalF, partial [Pseudomonas aeruginosa]|nr:GalU regulator GalF [Pseudomonas aeruginosa]
MHVLPAAKAIPKEIVPIVDKPMIQEIVGKIAGAGIQESFLVARCAKNRGESHSGSSDELQAMPE